MSLDYKEEVFSRCLDSNSIYGKFFYFIGDPNEINLKLFLAPDYYLATLERYEEIIKAKHLLSR